MGLRLRVGARGRLCSPCCRNVAALAAVVVSMDVYIGYAVGGVTDSLFVPLLIGAAAGWDRFATTRGPAAWRGPVCLGLAMAVKQTPWLILPFAVAGIVIESRQPNGARRAARDGLRYTGIALAAFPVPNLPYAVGAPAPGCGGDDAGRRAHGPGGRRD